MVPSNAVPMFVVDNSCNNDGLTALWSASS